MHGIVTSASYTALHPTHVICIFEILIITINNVIKIIDQVNLQATIDVRGGGM